MGWHLRCLQPALFAIPTGSWHCEELVFLLFSMEIHATSDFMFEQQKLAVAAAA
jgi:hypothetical protein